MLVTINIPVYNVYPYLREALDSVLKQTYKDLEIVIVDDGSTDGSSEVCDEYARKDSRITVIHQENKGLGNARNVGLEHTHGDIISFFDSDDIMLPTYVEDMISAMEQTQADVVVCKYRHFKHGGSVLFNILVAPRVEEGLMGREDALQALKEGKLNHQVWNKLYKRELWRDIRFPDIRYYQDIATTFRILDISKQICVINKILYIYRCRKGSNAENIHSKEWEWTNEQFHNFIRKV